MAAGLYNAHMQLTGEDAGRFAAIHSLLRKHQLQGVGTALNFQAEVDRAYEQTAEIMTRTIAHEAGHAVVGLALGAGDVLEWIAIYNVSGGTVGGGCKWGPKACPIEEQWMSHTAGMAAEKLRYGTYDEQQARWDKVDLKNAQFNPADLPAYLEKCGAVIQSHSSAWHKLQELLYERTIRDLTLRIDAIRQGNADVGHVMGQEARDIFAGEQVRAASK
jgi:hypothetical protein